MLLEHQRSELPLAGASAAASAWSARQGDTPAVVEHGQPEAEDQQQHLDERAARAYATSGDAVAVARLEAVATMMMVHHNHVPLRRGRPCAAVTAPAVSGAAVETTTTTTTTSTAAATTTTLTMAMTGVTIRTTLYYRSFFSATCD